MPEPEFETVSAAPIEEPSIAERREVASQPTPIRTSMEDQASLRIRENADAANTDEATPMSPSSPNDGSKVKNWLKTKFSRRMSKAQKPSDKEKDASGDKAFVGGAALTGASANNSSASLGAQSSSVRDVAFAGKAKEEEPFEERGRANRRDSEVSAISSVAGRHETSKTRSSKKRETILTKISLLHPRFQLRRATVL